MVNEGWLNDGLGLVLVLNSASVSQLLLFIKLWTAA
jgi:hypothetical protein